MTEKEALLKMESYCSTAEHCIYDVRKKLDNCELQKDEAERIINKLQEQGFVDECRYAAAFVHDKLFFAKWGRVKISNMLWQKRISESIIADALNTIDDDEYIAILKYVINSKKRGIKGKTEYERSAKLIKSVASRGFEIPLITRFVKIEEL